MCALLTGSCVPFFLLQSGNDGLNDLDLSWNSIRKKGAVALVNALKVGIAPV